MKNLQPFETVTDFDNFHVEVLPVCEINFTQESLSEGLRLYGLLKKGAGIIIGDFSLLLQGEELCHEVLKTLTPLLEGLKLHAGPLC